MWVLIAFSADAVPTRRQDAIGIERPLDGGADLGERLQPCYRLCLKIEWCPRDRIARLPIGRHQRPVAGADALTLLWVLAVKDDDVQRAAQARAAHIFGDVLQPVLAQDAA